MDVFVMDRKLVCAVQLPDRGERVARWAVYDLDNKKLSWGFSEGVEKTGTSCIPMAMENAKRAARRILRAEKQYKEKNSQRRDPHSFKREVAMMKKTAAALKAYDQLLAKDVSDTVLEEQRKAVAIAFSKESPNSEERCLELIYPGPPAPGPGRELSFVRQMVEMSKTSDMRWNDRLVQYARVRGYKDPAKLLDAHKDAMLEFRFWIQRKWQEWYTHIGVGTLSIEKQRFYQDHEKFDAWLAKEKK